MHIMLVKVIHLRDDFTFYSYCHPIVVLNVKITNTSVSYFIGQETFVDAATQAAASECSWCKTV